VSFEVRVSRWLEGLEVGRAALIVTAVGVVVYANSLLNGFAYDDVSIIVENTTIQSWDRLPRALLSPYWPIAAGAELALWRPVTTGLFGLQYLVGGGSPLPFHVVNVLLHAVASGLLVLVLARLMSTPVALIAGLVFAVHPVHTEAVANVVGQAEIVAAAAVLAALLVHLSGGERSRWGRSLAIAGIYALGFGAKESAITLLGLVFLVDAAREHLGFRDLQGYLARRWRLYFCMMVVAVGMLTARDFVLGGATAPTPPAGFGILEEIPRIWTLGEVWTHYVRLWAFPLDLSSDYSPNVIPVSTGWHAVNITGVLLALLLLVGTLVAWRRPALGNGSNSAKIAAFGVVWFLITISPISNTLFLSGVMLAERTLYLPSAGLAAAVGWLFVRMFRERPKAAPLLLVVVLLAGSVRTWTRNPAWFDHQTVFNVLARDYPQSGRAQWLLADSFMNRGQESRGLFAYRAAVNLLDAHYGLLTHVARVLIERESYRSADGVLNVAIMQRPEHPLAYGIRAGVRAELGDARGAERYARATLAFRGTDGIRLHLLAWALAARGAWDDAAEARARADERARVDFWQRFVYDAWIARRDGDAAAMNAALDSARSKVGNQVGASALDSILVRDFGLEPGSVRWSRPLEGGAVPDGAETPPR
jgi:protein O-mannosyl-transferase